jgi:hypothetical protein
MRNSFVDHGTNKEDQEEVVYKYNNGEVLVTNGRVVIGKESWPVNAIQAIRLETIEDYSRTRQTLLRGDIFDRIAGPIFLAIIGLLLMMFPPIAQFQLITFFVGGGLFLSGVGAAAYVQMNTPVNTYKLSLMLRGEDGRMTSHESKYTYNYKPQAVKTLHAVQRVLAANARIRRTN